MKSKSIHAELIKAMVTDTAVKKVSLVPTGNNTIINLNVGESDSDISLYIAYPFEKAVQMIESIRKGVNR